jgi:hypothetical protein
LLEEIKECVKDFKYAAGIIKNAGIDATDNHLGFTVIYVPRISLFI